MEERQGYMTDFFKTLDEIATHPKALNYFYKTCRKMNICNDTLSGKKTPDEQQFQQLNLAAQKTQMRLTLRTA